MGDLFVGRSITTSPLQFFPLRQKLFRYFAPLYPWAFERFDLRRYDLIVSSTTSWAKGVRCRADALHICYINNVSRFLCEDEHYVTALLTAHLPSFSKRLVRDFAQPMLDRLIAWDLQAAARPSAFIANSHNVARRVRQYYGRDAFVLPCPVDVDKFVVGQGAGGYALVISRLLPYKRIDLAIDACREVDMPLVVIGGGPAAASLRAQADGANVQFLGEVDDTTRQRVLADAAVVLLPGQEDFGLVPLEAAAAGRPTIALRAGGALETLREGITGAYFDVPQAASLAQALREFRVGDFDPQRLRLHALEFSPERFIERLHDLVARIQRGETAPSPSSIGAAGSAPHSLQEPS